MPFEEVMRTATLAFEAVGVAVLTAGALFAGIRYVIALFKGSADVHAYRRLRDDLGRSILLGLEILVAADIIRTLAVAPSLANVGVLGLIVLIRTFLSFSLEIEIDGVLPWRRAPARAESSTVLGQERKP